MLRQTIHKAELDLSYTCNLKCNNCDRLCNLLQQKPEEAVTVGHVEELLRQSVDLDYPWEAFAIVGGEPTLHPELDKILELLHEYRAQRQNKVKIVFTSNGHTDATKKRVNDIHKKYPYFTILNSSKVGNRQPQFTPMCVAPRDLDPIWAKLQDYPGCLISEQCGMGWNAKGFFPCAMAGAMDRVIPIGAVAKLRDVSQEVMAQKRKVCCDLCGFALHAPILHDGRATMASATWKKAFDAIGCGGGVIPAPYADRFIVVAGPVRPDVLRVAAALNALGVQMGIPCQTGGYKQDVRLEKLLDPKDVLPRQDLWFRLREWYTQRGLRGIQGAAHPRLCVYLPDVAKAFTDVRVISVNLDSRAPKAVAPARSKYRMEERDRQIAEIGLPGYSLDPAMLSVNPRSVLQGMAEFCGMHPSADEIEGAALWVR